MTWRYSILSLIIVAIALARAAKSILPTPREIPREWLAVPPHSDPEGRLAMGEKIALACADHSALILVKGVSDTIAAELLTKREEIIEAADEVGEEAALQRAHGVGKKTAAKLIQSISLTERCEPYEPYVPLERRQPIQAQEDDEEKEEE